MWRNERFYWFGWHLLASKFTLTSSLHWIVTEMNITFSSPTIQEENIYSTTWNFAFSEVSFRKIDATIIGLKTLWKDKLNKAALSSYFDYPFWDRTDLFEYKNITAIFSLLLRKRDLHKYLSAILVEARLFFKTLSRVFVWFPCQQSHQGSVAAFLLRTPVSKKGPCPARSLPGGNAATPLQDNIDLCSQFLHYHTFSERDLYRWEMVGGRQS